MNLSSYMKMHNLDDDALAARIGDCSASAVRKWKYGHRVPRPDQMARIIAATAGEVTPNDFFDMGTAPSAEAAQ